MTTFEFSGEMLTILVFIVCCLFQMLESYFVSSQMAYLAFRLYKIQFRTPYHGPSWRWGYLALSIPYPVDAFAVVPGCPPNF